MAQNTSDRILKMGFLPTKFNNIVNSNLTIIIILYILHIILQVIINVISNLNNN